MAASDKALSMDDLRDDIEKLKSDMSTLLETLGHVAADGGRESIKSLKKAGARAQAQAERSIDSVEQQIVERPLSSVLVAFGVGMLLGKLMDRR